MEIVLGIDNIVFLSIVTADLPPSNRTKTRRVGLVLALGMRIGLLMTLSMIMHMETPLFSLLGHGITGRDLVLILGGAFLVGKSGLEIYEKLEEHEAEGDKPRKKHTNVPLILVQIMILDIVFSLDSVITAVGMAQHRGVMIVAMLIAVGVMVIFAGQVGDFVNRHPSVKILALAFLVLIGGMLFAEGFGAHVAKATVYTAMGFSLAVELINMRLRKKTHGKAPLPPHGPKAPHE
jgi:predicted tellurium resistance membrane protein TerC